MRTFRVIISEEEFARWRQQLETEGHVDHYDHDVSVVRMALEVTGLEECDVVMEVPNGQDEGTRNG